MDKTVKETNRRRELQTKYNKEHRIEPKTIYKTREEILGTTIVASSSDGSSATSGGTEVREEEDKYLTKIEQIERIQNLGREMRKLAKELKFEEAAKVRDRLKRLKAEAKKKETRTNANPSWIDKNLKR